MAGTIQTKYPHYDYLIVGSGLYGSTFAYLANKAGKKCLVIDRRPQFGGNILCENINGIHVINMARISSILLAKRSGIL